MSALYLFLLLYNKLKIQRNMICLIEIRGKLTKYLICYYRPLIYYEVNQDQLQMLVLILYVLCLYIECFVLFCWVCCVCCSRLVINIWHKRFVVLIIQYIETLGMVPVRIDYNAKGNKYHYIDHMQWTMKYQLKLYWK